LGEDEDFLQPPGDPSVERIPDPGGVLPGSEQLIPHALSRALSSSPAADSFYLDRWATISHAEGLQGINSCFAPTPLARYQTAHLSRARRLHLQQLAQETRFLCLNVLSCSRRLTREILQKTEL